jgi:hypothetical protein
MALAQTAAAQVVVLAQAPPAQVVLVLGIGEA